MNKKEILAVGLERYKENEEQMYDETIMFFQNEFWCNKGV